MMAVINGICDEKQLDELKNMFGTDDDIDAIQMAVKTVLKKNTYEKILSFCGKVNWEGDLDEMRSAGS